MRDWRRDLGLEPHPEGGYYRRIYASSRTVALPGGERPLATSIHYLLTREQPCGRLHRNRSDILHFLIDGGPAEYLTLTGEGSVERVVLDRGGCTFLLVPGGVWKGSRLVDGASYALVAEVVTPGFDYADHEFAAWEDVRHLTHLHKLLRPFLP
ncbi:cupin domain-containing protein [Streptomyces sp. PR69]|uniref:cupin domain-containing protein n=1 Tax=Streptomyces sp. PR69 TaxID=2984950 RepID=UPI002264364D|nr:cupin domain-containing protein [Streptomyces sp. PR69]